MYRAAYPLGYLQTTVQSLQDHFETARFLYKQREYWGAPPEHIAADLDWEQLQQRMDEESPPYHVKENDADRPQVAGTEAYLQHLDTNDEWTDLALLLRVLKELHFDPLLLGMPNNGDYFAAHGITPKALSSYPHHLRALAKKYSANLADFSDHIDDPRFVYDCHDHLSRKGWIYYDKALDDFYHSRPLRQ